MLLKQFSELFELTLQMPPPQAYQINSSPQQILGCCHFGWPSFCYFLKMQKKLRKENTTLF